VGRRRGPHTLATAFEPAGAVTTDLLERPTEDGPAIERQGHTLRMRLRPFQIVTVRLTRAGGRKRPDGGSARGKGYARGPPLRDRGSRRSSGRRSRPEPRPFPGPPPQS